MIVNLSLKTLKSYSLHLFCLPSSNSPHLTIPLAFNKTIPQESSVEQLSNKFIETPTDKKIALFKNIYILL